jgi:hypothetical protein
LAFVSFVLFFLSLYHRPFLLAFVSSVLFFWPLYHLSLSFGLCIICPFLQYFSAYFLLSNLRNL